MLVAPLLIAVISTAEARSSLDGSGPLIMTSVGNPQAATAMEGSPVAQAAPAGTKISEGLDESSPRRAGDEAVSPRVRLGPAPSAIVIYKSKVGGLFAVRTHVTNAEGRADGLYRTVTLKPLPLATVVASPSTSDPLVTREGVGPTNELLNAYVGRDPTFWATGVPVYAAVRSVSAGGGLSVTESNAAWKQRLRVSVSERNAYQVCVTWDGYEPEVAGNELILSWREERVRVPSPRAWQNIGGHERAVDVHWTTQPPDGQRYGVPPTIAFLQFGPHDPSQNLEFEFETSRWTYQFRDDAYIARSGTIAIDEQGWIYVADKGVVEKFDRGGHRAYTTFIGYLDDPANTKVPMAICPDGKGNLLVASGPAYGKQQPLKRQGGCPNECQGVFVAKLGPRGELLDSALVATPPELRHLAIDRWGMLYIDGFDWQHTLDATRGFLKTDRLGGFVAKVGPALSSDPRVVYATYLDSRDVTALAFDSEGHIIVGVITIGGGTGILRIDPSKSGEESLFEFGIPMGQGHTLESVSSNPFLPPSTRVTALAADRHGNYYAGGRTHEPVITTNPHWTASPDLPDGKGLGDGFVLSLDPHRRALRWATRTGNGTGDEVIGLAVDGNQNVFVLGSTKPGLKDPATHLFVAKMNSLGTRTAWRVLLGTGTSSDGNGECLAISPEGDVFAPVGFGSFDSAVTFHQSYLGEVNRWRSDPNQHFDAERTWATLLRVSRCKECPAVPSIDRLASRAAETIEISGSGFAANARVLVNGREAARVTFRSSKALLANCDRSCGEDLEITVVNPDEQSATAYIGRPSAAKSPAPKRPR